MGPHQHVLRLALAFGVVTGCHAVSGLSDFNIGGADGAGGRGGGNTVGGAGGGDSYAELILSRQPLAYWRFADSDPTAGAIDETDQMPLGDYRLGVVLQQPGVLPANPSAGFFGNGARVEATDTAAPFDFAGLSPFSLEAWVMAESFPDDGPVIIKQSGGDGYRLAIMADGTLRFTRKENNQNDDLFTQSPIAVGAWVHVVATFDGAEQRIYLDGALTDTRTSSRAVPATTGALRIGAASNSTTSVEARLDEVAIYGFALDGQQIAAHFAAASR